MRIVLSRHYIRALVVALPWVAAAQALGGELQITVTNNQPAGGFAISPVWIGVHDGTFKTFDPGAQASAAIQAVAELADTSKITASFAGHGAQTTVGGMPYVPGASVTSTLNVADPTTDRYLSYAAMVVPSNDFFIGNANPTAFPLFDASGNFLGPRTIQIFGANVWDAGTEVNNIAFGAAFIVGDNITDHVDENGTIMMVFGGGDRFLGLPGQHQRQGDARGLRHLPPDLVGRPHRHDPDQRRARALGRGPPRPGRLGDPGRRGTPQATGLRDRFRRPGGPSDHPPRAGRPGRGPEHTGSRSLTRGTRRGAGSRPGSPLTRPARPAAASSS